MQWKPVALVCTMVAFGFVVAPSTNIWGACPRNTVSFDHSVVLPAGVVLPPGEYTFQIADMPDLVLVRSKDCQDTFYLGFANAVQRPHGAAGASPVALGTAPAGEPTPVMAWYPSGDANGYEFRY
jgi:hypothetical protein